MSLKATEVVIKIDDGYDRQTDGKAREYIGASGVGHPCDAYQAYSLRGFPNTEPDARLKRPNSVPEAGSNETSPVETRNGRQAAQNAGSYATLHRHVYGTYARLQTAWYTPNFAPTCTSPT